MSKVWVVEIIDAERDHWDPVVFNERPTDEHVWGYVLEIYPNPKEEQGHIMDGDVRLIRWNIIPVSIESLPEPAESIPGQ